MTENNHTQAERDKAWEEFTRPRRMFLERVAALSAKETTFYTLKDKTQTERDNLKNAMLKAKAANKKTWIVYRNTVKACDDFEEKYGDDGSEKQG